MATLPLLWFQSARTVFSDRCVMRVLLDERKQIDDLGVASNVCMVSVPSEWMLIKSSVSQLCGGI